MDYRRFGVMLDCSSNGVLTVEAVKKHVDVLSKMGYNCIQLYTEDTYEIDGEPWFGYLRGRYTKAELKEIDAYAIEKGVELIPCMQTLAHLPAVKKNYAMQHLFDINAVLFCGEEKTYEFIDKCFATLAECFTSRTINIGMDEAYGLGRGKYLAKHGYREQFDIFTEHLARVCEIANKYGFKPIMWSDMFFRIGNDGKYTAHGARIPKSVQEKIPENVDLVFWEYIEPKADIYDEMLAAHKETGRNTWFAGSCWSHFGFGTFNDVCVSRMGEAMKSVRKQNIQDVFITLWGSCAMDSSYFGYLPALYAIRQMADSVTDMATIKAGFKSLFGYDYDEFCLLDLPNVVPEKEVGYWADAVPYTTFYQDLFLGYFDKDYENTVGHLPLDEYALKTNAVKGKMGEFAYLFDLNEKLLAFMDVKIELGLKTRKAYAANDKEAMRALLADYDEAVLRLREYYQARRVAWLKEYKGFGMEIMDIRLGGLERRILSCKQRLLSWLNGEISRIEELEAELLPVGRDAFYDLYPNVISRGRLI